MAKKEELNLDLDDVLKSAKKFVKAGKLDDLAEAWIDNKEKSDDSNALVDLLGQVGEFIIENDVEEKLEDFLTEETSPKKKSTSAKKKTSTTKKTSTAKKSTSAKKTAKKTGSSTKKTSSTKKSTAEKKNTSTKKKTTSTSKKTSTAKKSSASKKTTKKSS